MIVENGKYYLYRHIRKDTGEVFYVGVGTKDKRRNTYNSFRSIYYRAFNRHHRSEWWKKIVNKTDYEIEILIESDDKNLILKKEIEFIFMYGRLKDNSGTLVNFSKGGSMSYNHCPTIDNNNFMKLSKRVYAYNIDGHFIREFDSAISASSFFGKSSAYVSGSIRRKESIGDYIFSYEKMGNKIDFSLIKIKKKRTPVIQLCYKTKEVVRRYNSIQEAASLLKIKESVIYSAIRKKERGGLYNWIKEEELGNINNIVFKKKERGKPQWQ